MRSGAQKEHTVEQSSYVRGHDGRRLTLADIPSPDTGRWVIRRKVEVIAAVNGGLLSLEEACSRYALNTEEFKSWEASYKQHGLAGLRITRLQTYSANTAGAKGAKRRPQDHHATNISPDTTAPPPIDATMPHRGEHLDYSAAKEARPVEKGRPLPALELGGTRVRDTVDLRIRLALLRGGEVAELAVSRPGGILTVRVAMVEPKRPQ
jgi:hypothetical protein